ncbi:MAG: hypothetical protein KDA84_16420 [Planctomycetaceae bacterium]|nr:hypothetical protein [Planctomycetaceae bacterium]
MNDPQFSATQLLGYVDEILPIEMMTTIETALRESESLRREVSQLIRRRDAGEHSVGQIWQRMRLSCPDRGDLGSYLLGALPDEELDYIEFHLQTVGCRYCAANLEDLRETSQPTGDARQRRKRFFQSSAGFLPRTED